MSSVYYRGDNRKPEDIRMTGFQPRISLHRGRRPGQAIEYIQRLIKSCSYRSLSDIGAHIISSSKGDSVSASCTTDGASYGMYKYQITIPDNALYFEFRPDGSVGAPLASQGHMYGRKPYYILTNIKPELSQYVIVGTRTVTQEATFFTDIPGNWISLIR